MNGIGNGKSKTRDTKYCGSLRGRCGAILLLK